MAKWEPIEKVGFYGSDRLRVPQGWIVRTLDNSSNPAGVAQTFIKDPDHQWNLENPA